MIFKHSLMILKCLFLGLIIVSILFGLRISDQFRIDTNLSELSPQNQHSPQTKSAIDELSKNIEQRALLLIVGDDEDSVFSASDDLRSKLNELSGLRVHPDANELAESLLETLTPYRFSLLTDEQRETLTTKDTQTIAHQAKNDMFALSSIRFLPFNEDPLGWHSHFIQQLFSSLQPPNTDSEIFHSVVAFSISNGAMDIKTQETLNNSLDVLTDELISQYDIKLERSGIFFFASDAASTSKKDIGLISTGSTIGVIFLLLLAFRSIWSLILPVSSVLLGVIFAFIVTHSIYGSVHVLTIVFGASLIGIVIDYSLHYFYHVSASSLLSDSQLPGDNSALYRALSLSLLTSLIGYSSLGFSDLQALQKVAVFSCCGLFMAWLSVICIGNFGTRKKLSLDQTILPHCQFAVSRIVAQINKQTWFVISLIIIFSGLILGMNSDTFKDDPRLFFKASEHLLNSERAVAEVANDYEPGRYVIVQGSTNDQIYQRAEQFRDLLKQTPEFDIDVLTSLITWVPSFNEQKTNYQLQSHLYSIDGAAQQLIQQISADNEIAQTLTKEYQRAESLALNPITIAELLGQSTPPLWIVNNDLITSFMLIHKGSNTQAIDIAAQKIDGIEFVNTLQRTTNALQKQRYSATRLLLFAYLLIAILLTLRYRSLLPTSMLLVPLASSSCVLIICVLLGQSLNLFHVMAMFLVLGFGMDYTIFTREINDMRAITLQAILLSAITSLLSFGLLSISSIPVAQSFGVTLLIGNCFNLFGVFVYAHCINSKDDLQI